MTFDLICPGKYDRSKLSRRDQQIIEPPKEKIDRLHTFLVKDHVYSYRYKLYMTIQMLL